MAGGGTIYRAYDARGQLLYIGMTAHVARIDQHRTDSAWFKDAVRIDLEHFATWVEASDAEVVAIRTEQPLLNRGGMRDGHGPNRAAPRRDLPSKRYSSFSLVDQVIGGTLAADLRAMRTAGDSYDTIAAHFTGQGVPCSRELIRRWIKSLTDNGADEASA